MRTHTYKGLIFKRTLCKRLISALLCLISVISLAACGIQEATEDDALKTEVTASKAPAQETENTVQADVPSERYDVKISPRRGDNASSPLALATGLLDGCFSPFFYSTPGDADAVAVTQLPLVAVEGDGLITAGVDEYCYAYSYSAQTTEGGGSVYTFVLKNGITFSDGVPVTASDLLFTLYVLCDPLYDGSVDFGELPIVGIDEYRTQADTELYTELKAKADAIFAAGINANGAYPEELNISESDAEEYWSNLAEAGELFAQEIVTYVWQNYSSYAEDYLPAYDAETIANSESLRTALAMAIWGYGSCVGKKGKFTDSNGAAYDLNTEKLDAAVFWKNIYRYYGSDFSDSGVNYEAVGKRIEDYLNQLYISEVAGRENPEGVDGISGITSGVIVCEDGTEREYVSIELTATDNSAAYSMAVSVAPRHYYAQKYSGEVNAAGVAVNSVEFMSAIRAMNSVPLGAGPYVYSVYLHGMVDFIANESFLLGSPKIARLRYRTVAEGGELTALQSGLVDLAMPTASIGLLNAVNSGEEGCEGLSYLLASGSGYGYIGIQAQAIPETEVRQAIACAMNTKLPIEDYFGELAERIYYPLSLSSWAYPDDAESVFTYDGTGEASKALFLDAGYIYDEKKGKMYYPKGHAKAWKQVKLTFTLPAESAEAHPAGTMFLEAEAVLESIGVDVTIEYDPNMGSRLADAYSSGLQVWAAAWNGGSADPDMFENWYSDSSLNVSPIVERTGLSYLFSEGDEETVAELSELNSLILAARDTLNTELRRGLYAKALPLAVSLAVEIPTYSRKTLYVYNSERVDGDSLLSGAELAQFTSPVYRIWEVKFK